MLCLALWTLIPRPSRAEGFLYLPITRSVVITASFCGYRTSAGNCHGGTDYDVRDDGDGIIAAAAGIVERVMDNRPNTLGKRGEYGNYVQILHDNGYRTIYGHLKTGSLLVRVGDHVRIGAPLGVGDNSGWSTGSHLHFEVRDSSGHKVDPYGDSPRYPNCGTNALWVNCPPVSPADVDQDHDGSNLLSDCDDGNADVHPGATERCNGRDDDCDTILDNWAYLGAVCTVELSPTCVRSGTWVCSTDETTIVCNADTTVGAERCDSVDNDCDTETDEDWRTGMAGDLGNPCEVGRGECRRSGVFVCTPDGLATACDADYASGTTEVCDGLDNDCDGYTDDFCLCEVAHPHPSCLCRRCDAPCSSHNCIVISLSPFTYGCHWHGGCYYCGSLSPDETDWTCTDTLSCVEYTTSEFCVDPEAAFCASHCPWPY